MALNGFAKLFTTLVTSTIWGEEDKIRIVWITMLALKNEFGVVESSVPGLATMARVDVEWCRKAIEKFKAPDPDSRTKAFEGRRIEEVEGGWLVLNHKKYQDKFGSEERREYKARKARQYRAEDAMVKKARKKKVSECTPEDTMDVRLETGGSVDQWAASVEEAASKAGL